MAGDMPELNTDSFVDTIANTVGILIVLVVVSLATYGVQTINANPELRTIYNKTIELEGESVHLETEVDGLTEEVAGLEEEFADEIAALDQVTKEYETVQATLMGKKAQRQELEGSLTSLRKKREAGRKSIATLKETIDATAKEFAPEDLAYLEDASLEGMEADLATIEQQTDQLAADAVDAASKTDESLQRISSLKEEEATFEGLIDELREIGLARVVVQNPLVPFERQKKGLWVECFGDAQDGAQPVGKVRVISDQTYKKVDDKLTAVFGGETKQEVRRPGSAFRAFLAGLTEEQKDSYFIHFFVQPDAYPVFRAAREIAAEAGWEVRWDPTATGTNLMSGRPIPPR